MGVVLNWADGVFPSVAPTDRICTEDGRLRGVYGMS